MDAKTKLTAWMRDILSKNRWTAEDWARAAKTSPTNITRFLGKGEHMPSGRILDALAEAAHSVPPLGPPQVNVRSIPFKMEGQVEESKFHTVCELSSKAFALTLETDSMSLGGMLPNDVIVVEPEDVLPVRYGSILAYQERGKVNAGTYFPPYIVPSSSNSDHLPLNFNEAQIHGTIVQQVRNLSFGE